MNFLSRPAWILRSLVDDTPRRNLAKFRRWLVSAISPRRSATPRPANDVLDGILESPCLPSLLAHAASRLDGTLVFAGEGAAFVPALEKLRSRGRAVEWREFGWGAAAASLAAPGDARVILCLVPVTADEWERVAALKHELGGRLMLLTELLLPFTRLLLLQRRLDYYLNEPGDILPFYLGEKFFGPLDRLNELFPLKGKSVIEFGPFDGCQTAGLVHCGAARVTCIEARAENATKTGTAAEIFGWPQVHVAMDDFHNADAVKFGRHDLAFAHGVYYHAVAPFVFLENLCSLADAIFVGGFCATDDSPASPWLELRHGGRTYRAKQYRECTNFTAGVNSVAYFFHGDDLRRFFTERGYRVAVISDEASKVTAGQFLRFLARR